MKSKGDEASSPLLVCPLDAFPTVVGSPAKAAGPLVLSATGKDGTFLDKPLCWVTLQVNNPTSDELTLFATELRAVDSVTGKALETASLPVVGIAGGKLAPQSVSKPWPLNVRETRCANVAVRFTKLVCIAGGGGASARPSRWNTKVSPPSPHPSSKSMSAEIVSDIAAPAWLHFALATVRLAPMSLVMTAAMRPSRWLPGVMACGLLLPLAARAESLSQLACAAGVHCTNAVTPLDAQIILNVTQEQAQAKFIEASQDWDATVWRCAAGGRTCGPLSQMDAQILIGLPEAAYGPAEQLRERGPAAPTTPATPPKTPAQKPRPQGAAGKPGVVVESLPTPGPGGYREVPLSESGTASVVGDIQPLDGVWTLSPGTPQAVGCMAGIAQSVARGMPAPQSGPVTFEKPFKARQLIKSDKITWKRRGSNHYSAQLVAPSTAMTMGYDVRVTSATQMQWQSVVTVRIPGQPVCTITTPLSYLRQGS